MLSTLRRTEVLHEEAKLIAEILTEKEVKLYTVKKYMQFISKRLMTAN